MQHICHISQSSLLVYETVYIILRNSTYIHTLFQFFCIRICDYFFPVLRIFFLHCFCVSPERNSEYDINNQNNPCIPIHRCNCHINNVHTENDRRNTKKPRNPQFIRTFPFRMRTTQFQEGQCNKQIYNSGC